MSYFSFVLFYLVVLWRWKWWGLIRRTKNPEVSRRSGLQEETVSGIKSWINYCYLIHKLIYELCQWQAALDEYGSCLSLIPAGNTSVKRDVLEGIARCCCHLGKKEEALTACEKLVNLVNYWLQHILCKHLLIYYVLLTEDRRIQHLPPHLCTSAGAECLWTLQRSDKQHLQPSAAVLSSPLSSVVLAESGHELSEAPGVWWLSRQIQHWGRTRPAAGDKEHFTIKDHHVLDKNKVCQPQEN